MNIRAVKKKTKSIANVKKITKAMQLVSAFKMKKSQQLALEGKPYQNHLQKIIGQVVQKIDPSYSRLIGSQNMPVDKELVILISSNKGLCGSFNFSLYNFLLKNVDFKKNDFVVIGRKGSLFAYKMGAKIVADFSTGSPLSSVSAVFKMVLENFLQGNYQRISLIYNRFVSTLKFETVKDVILPITYQKADKEKDLEPGYLIEPSPKEIIDPLLQSFVEQKIRHAIIESEASEHSSRMMAMKNATDNADDVIYNLTLLGNKLRQEKITSELSDMITAKESVENN